MRVRMGRSEYWLKVIVSSVGLLMLMFIELTALSSLGLSLVGIVVLVVFRFIWSIRRFHDVGLSGVWLLLDFAPGVGSLIVFILLLLPSDTFDTYQAPDRRPVGRV